MGVQFTGRGIQIDDKEIPYYTGTFHYWRSLKSDWRKILCGIKDMGFQIVETYIPWRIHEVERGKYVFDGSMDNGSLPERDLESFLDLCEEIGLYIVVRPGPHINGEMDCFGYPDWIVSDPKYTAKNPMGTEVVYPYAVRPFSIPSYASKGFYSEVKKYFQAMAPVLKAHAYPNGGVIAIQAENETCNFFRDNPFVMDYSIESVSQFARYLEEKFGKIEVLNDRIRTDYRSFHDVQAPAGLTKDNYLLCREWVCFKEYQILDSIGKITGFIMDMDLKIPVFHNCAYQTYSPISVERIEEIPGMSVAGIDAYPEPGDTDMLKERIRFLCGSSRLPFVPEFGSGSYFDRGEVLSPEEEEFSYLYAFMNGMKAVGFYMLVERNRWTGSPIRQDGSVRKGYYDFFSRLMHLLRKFELFKDRRVAKVLILKNYDMSRIKGLSCSEAYSSLSSNCFVKGPDVSADVFKQTPPEELRMDIEKDLRLEKWIKNVAGQLDRMNIAYDYSDQYVGEDKMNRYHTVFASAYPSMSLEYAGLLKKYSEGEDHQLIIGPYVPEMDEYLAPCRFEAKYRLLKTNESIPGMKSGYKICSENSRIETNIHHTENADILHLYIANTGDAEEECTAEFSEIYHFSQIWPEEKPAMASNSLNVHMQPKTVRIFVMEK